MKLEDLKVFSDRSPNYSKQFCFTVAALGTELSASANIPVLHNSDMNYASAQSLSILFISDNCEPTTSRQAANRELRIYVSSKDPLFCTLTLILDHTGHWRLSGPTNIPHCLVELELEVTSALLRQHYQKVDQDLLWETLPGSTNELDGSPATVFSALFSEIL